MVLEEGSQLKNLSVLTLLPTIGPDNLEDFFEKFDIYKNFAGWPDDQACDIIKLKAGPQVKSVISSSEEWKAINDVKVLKEKLGKHFSSPKSASDALQEFSLVRQKSGESIRDFAVRVESCALKTLHTKIDGVEVMSQSFRKQLLLNQFLNGVNPNLKAMLVIQNPASFAEACQLAERIELAQSGQVESANAIQSNDSLSKLLLEQTAQYAKTVEALQKSLDELKLQLDSNPKKQENQNTDSYAQGGKFQRKQPQYRERNSGSRDRFRDIVCFRCNRAGHIAKNCSVDMDRQNQGQRGNGYFRGNAARRYLN